MSLNIPQKTLYLHHALYFLHLQLIHQAYNCLIVKNALLYMVAIITGAFIIIATLYYLKFTLFLLGNESNNCIFLMRL